MNETLFVGHPVKRFDYKDLDGKILRIVTGSEGRLTLIGGVEEKTGVVYILGEYEEPAKRSELITWYRPKLYRNKGEKGWREGRNFHWESSKDIFDMMESFQFFGWDKMEAPP